MTRGRSAGTLHFYGVKLGHLVRVLPERLADVDARACETYLRIRTSEGAAQTTVKKELRALGSVLRHARRLGLYDRDPSAVLPELADGYRPRERFLLPTEFAALCLALPPSRAAHVVFIVGTGARWGESLAWRAGDITPAAARIRGTKTDAAARVAPVPPYMQPIVASALGAFPPPLEPWTNVRRALGDAARRLGILPVTPNDLRRTYATWLRQRGAPLDVIALAMGHTSSRMVERVYGRMGAADVARVLGELC